MALQADATRSAARDDGRTLERRRPREPHERYQIDESRKDPNRDYMWLSLSCRGEPNPRLNDFFDAGWVPEAAQNFPRNSGINVAVSQRLIDLGHMKPVNPDDPIIDNNMMLVSRPKALSRESRAEDEYRAQRQIGDHMDRLKAVSKGAIGDKTVVQRRMTHVPAAPDGMIPEDAEI